MIAACGGTASIVLCLSAPAAQAVSEGKLVRYAEIEALQPYLPPVVWQHRTPFFHAGMEIAIGPSQRDYSAPPSFTSPPEPAEWRWDRRLPPLDPADGRPVGLPFPAARCDESPAAAERLAHDFLRRWQGQASSAHFRATRIPQGDGDAAAIGECQAFRVVAGYWTRQWLAHRVEPELWEGRGDLFRGEKRQWADAWWVDRPHELRGTHALTFRYRRDRADDAWLYVPIRREHRRIDEAERLREVLGSELMPEDLFGFDGRVGDFDWSCLGERTLLAPINSAVPAYPIDRSRDFGPDGASLATDRWELRRALGLRLQPRRPEYPYGQKELWIDAQTYVPLYAAAFDREGRVWRLFTFAHRWSEEDPQISRGWSGVEAPRSLRPVVEVVWSVRAARGVRLEHWDNDPHPLETKPLRCLLQASPTVLCNSGTSRARFGFGAPLEEPTPDLRD